MNKKLIVSAALLASGVASAQTFFTNFDNVTSAQVLAGAMPSVGGFASGTSTGYLAGDIGAQEFTTVSGKDRVIVISNLTNPKTVSLLFTLTAAAASINYSFWVSSNANTNGSAIVQVTGIGGYTQTATETGFGTSIGQNANPSGILHSGSFAGGIAGNYAITFSNATGNQGMRIDDVTVFTTPVPEPTSLALMLAGIGAVGFVVARRRSA